jgi:TolB protein
MESGQASARIAFVTYRGGGPANHGTIYVVNADGSGLRTLVRHVWDPPPAWSPDGRKLAFVRGVGYNAELYLTNADGSHVRRLTRDPALDLGPVWSPDGRRISFIRYRGGGRVRVVSERWVMNADGSSQRRLRQNADTGSPDGRKIAFVGENRDIYVANADGSGQRRLTHSPAYKDSLAWSPDGRSIAYVKYSRLGCCPNSELWVMNADGSGKHVVAFGELNSPPSWSPDGRTLVYGSSYRPNPNDPRRRFMHVTELFRVNADGSDRRRLAFGQHPGWSPDGRLIAFLRPGRLAGGLYVMNPDGSGQRRLTRSPASVVSYAWSPGRTS